MKKVIIESPYAADNEHDIQANINYARLCMADCLKRDEAPLASHLLYTQPGILDDKIPEERTLGINAGLLWGEEAEMTVVYTDKGITKGMELGIKRAEEAGRPVERRKLFEVPIPPFYKKQIKKTKSSLEAWMN